MDLNSMHKIIIFRYIIYFKACCNLFLYLYVADVNLVYVINSVVLHRPMSDKFLFYGKHVCQIY